MALLYLHISNTNVMFPGQFIASLCLSQWCFQEPENRKTIYAYNFHYSPHIRCYLYFQCWEYICGNHQLRFEAPHTVWYISHLLSSSVNVAHSVPKHRLDALIQGHTCMQGKLKGRTTLQQIVQRQGSMTCSRDPLTKHPLRQQTCGRAFAS